MAYTLADLMVRIGGDATGALHALDQTEGKIQSTTQRLENFSRSMAPLSAVITGVGLAGLHAFAGLEDAISEVSARTGLVGQELKRVEDFAVEMGAATQFSAIQAAEGLLQVITSGSSAAEAMEVLPDIMDLAAAGAIDLGYSADAVTDILAMFNLQVDESRRVVDTLSAAAGASSAEVGDMTQALQNVGPVARTFGLSLEETAATLAVLSENGIKAAESGTALRSLLNHMTAETPATKAAWDELGTSFFDAAGQARPFGEVIADIKEGLKDRTPEEASRLMFDLAGSYGVVALSALTGDLTIQQMTASMEAQNSAAEIASARMGTLSGRFDSFKGTVEVALSRAVRPLVERGLKPLLDIGIDAINMLGDLTLVNEDVTLAVGAFLAGLVALTAVAASLVFILPVLSGGFALITGTVLPLIAVIGGLGLAARALIGDFDVMKEGILAAFEEGGIPAAVEAGVAYIRARIDSIVDQAEETVTSFIGEFETAFETGGLEGVGQLILDKIESGLGDVFAWTMEKIVGPIAEALGLAGPEPQPQAEPLPLPDWMTSGVLPAPAGTTGEAEVLVKSLRLRAGPGTEYDIVGGLPEGASTAVLDVIENESGTWLQVLTESGTKAWMAAVYNDQALADFTPKAELMAAALITSIKDAVTKKSQEILGRLLGGDEPELSPSDSKLLGLMESEAARLGDWSPAETPGIDWGAKGKEIIESLFEGIGEIDTSKLTDPIKDAIDSIDWTQAGLDAIGFMEGLISTLFEAGVDAVTWVNDKVAVPIGDAIAEVDWTSALTTAGSTLDTILDTIGSGAADFSRWARINILYPVTAAIGEVDWAGTIGAAGSTLDVILDAMASGATSFTTWVSDKILDPIASELGGLTAADWIEANQSVADVFTGILDAIISGAGSFYDWVNEKIATPIGDELVKPELWEAVTIGVGAVILAAITWATDIAEWALTRLAEAGAALLDAAGDPNTIKQFNEIGSKLGQAIAVGMMSAIVTSTAWPVIQLYQSLTGTGGGGGGGGGGEPATPVPGSAPAEGGGSDGGSWTDYLPQPPKFFNILPGIGGLTGIGGVGPLGLGRFYDNGGLIRAGELGWIGTGAQPELFVPTTDGMMYPAGTGPGAVTITGPVTIQKVPESSELFGRVMRATERRNLLQLPERSLI